MDEYDVKRFGLITAIRVEVDGMIANNAYCAFQDGTIPYNDEAFKEKANEIRELCYRPRELL